MHVLPAVVEVVVAVEGRPLPEVEVVGFVHVPGALALELGVDPVVHPLLEVEPAGVEVDVVVALLQ